MENSAPMPKNAPMNAKPSQPQFGRRLDDIADELVALRAERSRMNDREQELMQEAEKAHSSIMRRIGGEDSY